jgi:4-hydroxy-2-oxoheptanedioate aldolase
MNNLTKILNKLCNLNCSGIKISFEDEGALYNEVISMRKLTSSINLNLYLKIGGCEAKRDIIDGINLDVDGIVAPMIESEFSLDKFIKSVEEYDYKNTKGFNLETIQGYINLDKLSNKFDKIDFVTVGRVDFVGSLNKDRSFVDSDEMYEMTKNIFIEAKKKNILCCMGGGISIYSKEFINNLVKQHLLDKFETRYVIFKTENMDFNKFEEMLFYANLFEVEWMKYISNRYNNYANKDIKRIIMIEERLCKNKLYNTYKSQEISRNVNNSQEMSRNVNNSQEILKNVNNSQDMSININNCQEISINVNYCQ